MTDSPDLCLRRPWLVNRRAAFLPLVAKYFVCKLACGRQAVRVIVTECIHNRICDGEGLILEGRVTRESGDEVAKGSKVPKKSPRGQVGNDEVSRRYFEVSIVLETK